MNERAFDELAGRIEGVGRALLLLATLLEQDGRISGPRFCEALRAPQLDVQQPVLSAAQRTLQELAQALDDARTRRPAVVC